MVHQKSIHGKLSEVMKMLALYILVLHDVSAAVLCQKEDGGLLKAPTELACQAETVRNDITIIIIIIITVRSPWAHRGTMISSCFLCDKLSRSRDWAEMRWWTTGPNKKKSGETLFLGCDDSVFLVHVEDVLLCIKHWCWQLRGRWTDQSF